MGGGGEQRRNENKNYALHTDYEAVSSNKTESVSVSVQMFLSSFFLFKREKEMLK